MKLDTWHNYIDCLPLLITIDSDANFVCPVATIAQGIYFNCSLMLLVDHDREERYPGKWEPICIIDLKIGASQFHSPCPS